MEDLIVEVEYRKPINKGGHMVKVIIQDLGVYIDGWRVTPSDRNPSGWWVQPPARNFNGKFIPTIEFDKTNIFWQKIEKVCVETVVRQLTDEQLTGVEDIEDWSQENVNRIVSEGIDRFNEENPKPIPWREPHEKI